MLKRAALLSSLTLLGVLLGASPALAGTGLSPMPGLLEFGEVDLHYGGSPQRSITFSDMQPAGSVDVESVAIAGAEPASFDVVAGSCVGAALELGQSCSVEVAFRAGSAPGAHSATIELATSEGLVEVPLSGSAITGTLSASPDPLDFAAIPYTPPGSHSEGENSETEQLTIQNSPNASTQVHAASIIGLDASSFSIQWNCDGVVLGTNNSCNLGIRFQPTSPGPKSASLVIDSDSSGGPLIVPLSGEGLHGPTLTLSTQQELLGDVALGSSTQQTLAVGNTGDYPLLIQRAFLVSGTPLMFPVLSDSCSGQVLYPGESCAIVVAFRPTTLGEKDASLLFITNTPTITVAGFDGVGVRAGAIENLPAVSMPSAPTDAPAPPAPSSAPAPALGPPAGAERDLVSPTALTALRPPRLYKLLGRSTIDPGVDVQCPVAVHGCEALGFIVASGSSHSAASGFGDTPALLGSTFVPLHSGQGAHVRIPLSRHTVALLRKQRQLRVRVGVVVQAAGTIVAERSWTLQLTAAGAVSRVAG